jgi:hypothetical protein
MIKEFNLSEKIVEKNGKKAIHPDYVKEFIRRLKDKVIFANNIEDGNVTYAWVLQSIDKLAGDKLK